MGHITKVKELLGQEGNCKHPPDRLFSWMAKDSTGEYLCVGCCECGKTWEKPFPIKKGGIKNEPYTRAMENQ